MLSLIQCTLCKSSVYIKLSLTQSFLGASCYSPPVCGEESNTTPLRTTAWLGSMQFNKKGKYRKQLKNYHNSFKLR